MGLGTVGILDGYQGLVEDLVVPWTEILSPASLTKVAAILHKQPGCSRYPDGTDANEAPHC